MNMTHYHNGFEWRGKEIYEGGEAKRANNTCKRIKRYFKRKIRRLEDKFYFENNS